MQRISLKKHLIYDLICNQRNKFIYLFYKFMKNVIHFLIKIYERCNSFLNKKFLLLDLLGL